MVNPVKKAVKKGIDIGVYSLLSEKQRKAIGDALPEKQKKMLQKLISGGKRSAEKDKLKQLKFHLYNLGFETRALEDLENFYQTTENPTLKREIAWEIALWHMNQNTKEGARKALPYIKRAVRGETNRDKLRKLAIITAECCDILHLHETGKKLINRALRMDEHPDLYLAKVNHETNIVDKLQWINKVMDTYNLQPVTFLDQGSPTYDDLWMESTLQEQKLGPKVSVIVPAYNAGEGLRTAIESILLQTWGNLEVLVVDDHSTDNTAEIVKEFMDKDSRVKLLQTPQNSGPYVARNVALREATGEFVTINDSDDWSHAQKIEIQVSHLIKNPRVIANTSEHARLTEDLKFYRRGTPGKYIFPNMSSIMFRREPVVRKIGYWDSVRFAADGEFKRRIIRVFGKRKYVDLKTGPLSLPRQTTASLTGSSAFGYNGHFKGVRKHYVSMLENYHDKNDFLYYPMDQVKRPFPVPEPMWPNREEKIDGKREFDLVIVADFRYDYIAIPIANELHRLKKKYNQIGLVQMYNYDLTQKDKMQPSILEQLDEKQVQFIVYGEKVETEYLVIYQSDILSPKQSFIPTIESTHTFVKTEDQGETAESVEDYFDVNHIIYLNRPISEMVETVDEGE